MVIRGMAAAARPQRAAGRLFLRLVSVDDNVGSISRAGLAGRLEGELYAPHQAMGHMDPACRRSRD